MGLQTISDRNVRRAAREIGLPLFRAMRHSNHLWFGWVRERHGHWHVEIDPATWDWEFSPGCGFSSCREGSYGPGVFPSDPAIVAEHDRREAAREAERERKDAEFTAFADVWATETRAWLESEEAAK